MNAKFIWYGLSLWFCVYNLFLLYSTKYEVTYYVKKNNVEEKVSAAMRFFFCLDFGKVRELKETDKNPNKDVVGVDEFILYAKDKVVKSLPEIVMSEEIESHFIYNKHYCFYYDKYEYKRKEFINFVQNGFKIFAFSTENLPFFFDSIYNRDFLNLTTNKFTFKILKQVVEEKGRPFSSCLDFLTNSKNQKEEYDKLNCLNNCLRDTYKYNSTYLYYSSDEQDPIELGHISKKFERKTKDDESCLKQIIETIEMCNKKECKYESCKWESFNTITLEYDEDDADRNLDDKYIELATVEFKAFEFNNYYWLNFLGLFALFTGTNVLRITTVTLKHLVELFFRWSKRSIKDQNKFLRNVMPKIKFGMVILSAFIVNLKAIEMNKEFERNSHYPEKTYILDFSTEAEPFDVIFCTPIEVLVLANKKYHEFEYNETLDLPKIDLNQLTFRRLKSLTDLNLKTGLIKEAYVSYGAKNMRLIWHIANDVIFIYGKFIANDYSVVNGLQRCFRLRLKFKERKYHTMNSIATVKIFFAKEIYKIYLVDKKQHLSLNLTAFDTRLKILKQINKSSRQSHISNCKDYEGERIKGFDDSKCYDRSSCTDLCIAKNFVRKHNSFSAYQSVIAKSMFETYLLDRTYFNTTRDYEIEAECLKDYEKVDCDEKLFVSTLKNSYPYRTHTVELDAYFEKLRIRELEYSRLRFLLNLLNLESILFDMNMHAILIVGFSAARVCLKLKWNKVYAFLFFLICLMGFFATIYLIFVTIIKNQLVDNMYLKNENEFKLPTLIFCFGFNESEAEVNKMLNGKYLDQLTKHLNFTSVFTDIRYYNKKKFKVESFNFSNNQYIRINYFYYFNMKCLSIANEITYEKQDLYFKNNSFVLKIFLNKKLCNRHRKVYILYHRDTTENDESNRQFNEIYTFRIGKVDNHTVNEEPETHLAHENETYDVYEDDQVHKYKIRLERFMIEVNDRFQWIKQPKILLFKKEDLNSLSNYLKKMKFNFKDKYNLTTKIIPLVNGSKDFNLQINEMLFDQFYYQVQNYSDYHYPTDNNGQRTVFNFYTQKYFDRIDRYDEPDFEIGAVFVSRVVTQTNDDSPSVLIQNILNALAFWLNINILNAYDYVIRIVYFYKPIYKFLTDAKTRLQINLELFRK